MSGCDEVVVLGSQRGMGPDDDDDDRRTDLWRVEDIEAVERDIGLSKPELEQLLGLDFGADVVLRASWSRRRWRFAVVLALVAVAMIAATAIWIGHGAS